MSNRLTLTVTTDTGEEIVFTEGQTIIINSLIKNNITNENVPFDIETTLKRIIAYNTHIEEGYYRGFELELTIKKFINSPFDKEIRRNEFERYYVGEDILLKLEYFVTTELSGRWFNRDKDFVEEFIT